VKTKEKAICEKAVDLWAQALDEGHEESTDSSGITIDIFKGTHYAIGALKGFWTPSDSGFVAINRAIADLERLLSNEEVEDELVISDEPPKEQMQRVSVPRPNAPDEAPDPRVKWRITCAADDAEDGYIYTTVGVNGYSVRKYFEETQPGQLIEMDGQMILQGEIPLTASFQDDNISDALFIWIDEKYPFEFIQNQFIPFQFLVEVYEDINEIMVFELQDSGPSYSTSYRLEEYGYEILDCINEIFDSGDNFKVVFLEQHV